MNFVSFAFLVFLAALLLLMAVFRRNSWRHALLLGAGIVFYGYWDWRFLALIAFTSVFDFYLGKKIGTEPSEYRRKRLLALDIAVNLSILIIFKYLNFFIDSANLLLSFGQLQLPRVEIPLPIGISFFVFEAMSYCIDVYRGALAPYGDWRNFGLFIFFFPRMIAGPIIRAADFLPQIRDRKIQFTRANVEIAISIFLLGLVKKAVLADQLAQFVDPVFARPHAFDSATVWAAVLAYSLQIFFDFSGYSDMAIGLAKLFNIDLPENFRLPYLSASISEFWRRWHISLSSWLRDYLYISLGGNRRGAVRTAANLLITMLLGGLWHGASWTFVIWGGAQGLLLIAEKLLPVALTQSQKLRPLRVIVTFLIVTLLWVLFRSPHLTEALVVYKKLFAVGGGGVHWIYSSWWPIALAAIVWHGIGLRRGQEYFKLRLNSFWSWIILWGIFFLVCLGMPSVRHPFIYFQF